MKTYQKLSAYLSTGLLLQCTVLVSPAQDFASTKNRVVASAAPRAIDTAFVGKNMRDNKMEIEMSELALQRSSSQEVKKAAQQMVTDHTAILNDLAKIAQSNNMLALPGYPTNGVASTTNTDANRTDVVDTSALSKAGTQTGAANGASGSNPSAATGSSVQSKPNTASTNAGSYNNLGTSGTTTAAGTANQAKSSNDVQATPHHGNDHAKMSGMSAMQTATGQAFDRLWIPQMLSMHEAKLSELTAVVNNINDSDLKTAVNAAIPKIRMHRDMLSSMNNSTPRK